MEFKVAAKAAAASLAPAPANQGAQGRSRVSFVSGPAPTRTKALRSVSNSATPVAKEERVDRSEMLTLIASGRL